MNYIWGKINFKNTGNSTDLRLYKERSYLLLPPEGEENRFMAKSSGLQIDYYMASTSESGYQAMRAFFMKLYDCRVDREVPERLGNSQSVALVNRRLRNSGDFSYFPGFLSNILYLPSALKGLDLLYEVVMRSSHSFLKEKRYNFCTLVAMEYEGKPVDEARDYIRNDIARLAKENKWKLRLKAGRRVRYRTDLLRDPSNLCNFVRFPYDEGI